VKLNLTTIGLAALAALGGAFFLGGLYGPALMQKGSEGALGAALASPAADRTDVQPTAAADQGPQVAQGGSRKVLYYRNPMGLPDVSPVPKKDSMGMDYIPVYEGEGPEDESSVKVSLEKVQRLGVVTEAAQLRDGLVRTVRAVGTIALDERSMAAVTTKIEGWVERLHLNTTGQAVAKGAPMLEIYSPDLVLAQQEYVIAIRASEAARASGRKDEIALAERLVEGAVQRLRYLDVSDLELARLRDSRTVRRRLVLRAPFSGQVMEKRVVEGMRVMPGEPLFELADLSTVWAIAEVFEQDLGLVEIGQPVVVSVASYPGQSFAGKVDFIYPSVDPETRTGRIRVEISNPDARLKEHMYATLALTAQAAKGVAVVVPESALLDSGRRQVVLVEKGEGRFEPREVKTGIRADGLVEISQGLAAGEKVVVRANFLIDAESNLQAALRAFIAPDAGETIAPEPAAPPPGQAPAATPMN
jgi:Cu(I)/Ag(I) efflux system membrane fusion protein